MSEVAVIDAHEELEVTDLVSHAQKIQQAIKESMRPDVHYGVIPGTDKPTLYKPGAEYLCMLFHLAPDCSEYTERYEDTGHYTATVTCKLQHIGTGALVATGLGLCSTHESKYAYRKAKRACPSCGAEAIIKGKQEYGGGWVCFKKIGGCGAKFADGLEVIESQQEGGKVPNPDLGDSWNTVLKLATKRALIAAVLNGTAASDAFTQDMGEDKEPSPNDPKPSPQATDEGTSEGDIVDADWDPAAGAEDIPFDPEPTPPDLEADPASSSSSTRSGNVGGEARASLIRAALASAAARGVPKMTEEFVLSGLEGVDTLEGTDEKQAKQVLDWISFQVEAHKAMTAS